MISLRTLGPVEVTVDGDTPPRELLWRKNLALLLYLARSPERRRSREHLVGVFWGDKPDASARHSLNEALRVIRKSAGEDVVSSVGDQVVLSSDGLEIDADQLEARLEAEQWGEAVRLMQGSFLEGFAVPDSSVFEDWLATERLIWLDRMGEGLRRHAETRLASGDGQAAQEAAVRALALDPFSDSSPCWPLPSGASGRARWPSTTRMPDGSSRISASSPTRKRNRWPNGSEANASGGFPARSARRSAGPAAFR
jgi:DNA-binding SARP family transcriptional activator